ncbi:hypothetical protein BHE74_00057923 [Ensete ventricosum]|nr:hypothetical protein BHE74_00057923 [Ensete ventricosum]
MTSASSSLLPSLVLFLLFARSSPALSASVVAHLPGYQGALPFYMETGLVYVTVDEVNGAELFYYFTASEGDPSQDPLLLWLTGGDRCSAFSGLAFEFVTSEYNGSIPTLTDNPYSWSKLQSCCSYRSIIVVCSCSTNSLATQRNADNEAGRQPHLNLKFFSEIGKAYILEPKCAFASPKPEPTVADRRTMEESHIKFLEPPPLPALYCRVS